jgi:NAD(P)H-hydrate epimerase
MTESPVIHTSWILPVVPRAEHPVPAVDRDTMLAADLLATDRLGVSLAQMMENAGRELASLARLTLGGSVSGSLVMVLAGTGNNASGGMVAARRLAGWGAKVLVVFARPILRLRPGPCSQVDGLVASGAELIVAGHDRPYPDIAGGAMRSDLLIDALIGYSLRGAPDDDYQPLIGMTSMSSAPVISLDVPSGIDATSGERRGAAVHADATLGLALPKLGTTMGEGKRFAGALYLADIGLPARAFRELGIDPGSPFSAGPLLRLD